MLCILTGKIYPHLPDQSNITPALGNLVKVKLLTGTADEGGTGRAKALTFFCWVKAFRAPEYEYDSVHINDKRRNSEP